MLRRTWPVRMSAMACLVFVVASSIGCGREDVPLDPDDDGGEETEPRGDGGTESAAPLTSR